MTAKGTIASREHCDGVGGERGWEREMDACDDGLRGSA